MKLTSKNNNNNNNYKNNNNIKRKNFGTPYEKPSSSNSNNTYNGKGKGDSNKGACLNQVSNSFSSFSPTHSNNKTRVSKSSSKSKSSKDTLLYYLFIFWHNKHKLILDTGAEKTLFSTKFTHFHRLLTIPTKTKQLILADQSRVAVKAETSAITIRLGHLECKIKGIVCPNLNVDIIA